MSAFEAVYASWEAAGRLSDGSLIAGGFHRLWLDVPGHVALYANQQGGYYVQCPVTGGNLARAFSGAVQAWRGGAVRAVSCPHCLQEHPLEAVRLKPPGAFGRGAVVFSDVGSADVPAGVQEALRPVLGDSRVVLRRRG